MRRTPTALLSLALLAATPPPGAVHPAKGSPEQRAAFEQRRAERAASAQRRLVEAGFTPLAEIVARRRTVRQAVFEDALTIQWPGIEIELKRGGRAFLTVIGPAGRSAPARLPEGAWAELIRLEGDLLLKPEEYIP
jgi:hypothetical protein